MSRSRLLDCTTRTELAELLDIDVKTLTYFAYGNGNHYKAFLIPRKSGGHRQIHAPIGPLITIQRKLAKLLSEIYIPPSSVHGFTNNRSIISNATSHLQKRIILNVDLEDFFPTISDARIIGLLKSKPFNFINTIASTLARLVCHNGSLPQGAPTSPVLSNMICLRLDNQLTRLSKELRVTYTRYADDITISSNSREIPKEIAIVDDLGFIELGNAFKTIVENNHFKFNDKKTRISTSNQSKLVTGIKVNTRLNVTTKYTKELRAMIHSAQKHGLDAAQQYFDNRYSGHGQKYENVLRGKLEHLKAVRGYYDMTYRSLHNKFVSIEGVEGLELPISPDQYLIEKILVVEGDGTGTGFILDNEWLITCDHVVGNKSKPEYYPYNDYPSSTRRTLSVNPDWRSSPDLYDLIALDPSISDLKSGFYSFESAPVDSVHESGTYRVVGFPDYIAGSRPHINPVTVTGLRVIDGMKVAFVNTPLISGYSGSPVLDDLNRVVGIVQTGSPNRRSGDEDYRHTFLPISEIQKCLQGFRSDND